MFKIKKKKFGILETIVHLSLAVFVCLRQCPMGSGKGSVQGTGLSLVGALCQMLPYPFEIGVVWPHMLVMAFTYFVTSSILHPKYPAFFPPISWTSGEINFQ